MHETSPREVADVEGISVSLTIDEKLSLFILLAEEGLINRMGTGFLNNTEENLFVGPGDPAIFQEVRSHLTEGMLQIVGREFQCANMRGASCKLQIDFQFKDNTSDGFAFLYGSDSEGPPEDVRAFVKAAAFLTETWYEDFKRTAPKSGQGPGKSPNRTSGAPRSSVLGRLRNWFRTMR